MVDCDSMDFDCVFWGGCRLIELGAVPVVGIWAGYVGAGWDEVYNLGLGRLVRKA